MVSVLIAMGSNLGSLILEKGFGEHGGMRSNARTTPIENIQRAINKISEICQVQAVSSVFQSAPMYLENQPIFYNAAILIETEYSPRELLRHLKRIEIQLGRQAREQNGPREIDLDIIAYGALIYNFQNELLIPHPRIKERRFVLAPIAEIAPSFSIPGEGMPIILLDKTFAQSASVVKVDHATLSLPSKR